MEDKMVMIEKQILKILLKMDQIHITNFILVNGFSKYTKINNKKINLKIIVIYNCSIKFTILCPRDAIG